MGRSVLSPANSGSFHAGLTPNELFDASAVVREFTQMFVGNKAYTNLPRKFNVTITACKETCSKIGELTRSLRSRSYATILPRSCAVW